MGQPLFQFQDYAPRPLEIIDTTLREGQQTSLLHDHYKYYFNQQDKVEIVQALITYGVKFIELFAPVVSLQEKEDFQAIRAARDNLITQKGYTFLLAHVRTHPADIEAAIDAGFDGLNMYIGTSLQSRRFNHGKDLDSIIRRARELIEDVRRHAPHLILRFSGEDAFRTPWPDLIRVYDEIAPLVDRFGTPDTVGIATPARVRERVQKLRERYPHVALEGHFHDDRGFALTNTLAAVQSGMSYLNTTILGIGERSGITSMTALLFNLYLEREYDLLEGYNLRGSYPINVMLADKLHALVPSREPVSLTNRTHTAGVHQKAVLNDASTYEALPLDLFGVTESEILLGPLSGWNVIHYFLREIKGFLLDETTARRIAARFKEEVYHLGDNVSPAGLLMHIATDEFQLPKIQVPEQFQGKVLQQMAPRQKRTMEVH